MRLCLSLLAHWSHDDPDSPELQRLLAEVRAKDSISERSLSDHNLDYLSQLFDPAGITDVPATFETANWVLELFDSFYHHAAPFDSRALFNAWRRCRADPRCGLELSRIREIGVPAG
jgi:hypothetical protein